MKRTFALAALLLGAAPSLGAPPAEAQDVVVLSDVRPYRIRLQIYVDGKSHSARWNDYLKRWFVYLDRNADGALDKDEAARVPPPAHFLALRQGNPITGGALVAPSFNELDTNNDGKVTLEEFTAYYAARGISALNASNSNFRPNVNDAAGEVLFKLLDVNGDGKLSKDELARAEELLRLYDTNDDELLTAQELLGNPGFVAPPPIAPGTATTVGPLQLVPADETGRLGAARAILERYDRDRDGKLSRTELGLAATVFAAFDADKNGSWDANEIARWLASPTDAIIVLRLGKTEEGQAPLEILAADAPGSLAVTKITDDALTLTLADLRLRLVRAATVEAPNARSFRSFYARAFRNAAGEKEAVAVDDLKKNQQLQFFVPLLPLLDRDGDGKITTQELNDYFDLAFAAPEAMTSLTVVEQGRGLFELLDANGDGRLSPRELKNAWQRLAECDRDGDGCISREELPRQAQITINAGPMNLAVANPNRGVVPARPGPMVGAARAPLWFRKMDLNGDGDVSLREWLGSPEEFKKIDSNGDGLISLDEAERYERRRHRE